MVCDGEGSLEFEFSLTDVVLVSIIILFINQITEAEFHFPLYAVGTLLL